MSFSLTYSTMFNPPEEMHERFDAAATRVRASLGKRHGLSIGGEEVMTATFEPVFSPIDHACRLGDFAVADATHVDAAVAAARAAFDGWRHRTMADRLAILRRAADIIEERVYDMGAAVALEVGKNRMEALGEVQETADFFRHYCDDFEKNEGFDRRLPNDPLDGWTSTNRSVMKPHGVWAVIVPFNFPFALAGGPIAAALVTGNTVVMKGAPTTPWSGRMLAECLKDAGLPAGVFNDLGGGSDEVGRALVSHRHVAGVTFTGSHEVGMAIQRQMLNGPWPKPVIAEMGGKNACYVSKHADLERAVLGISRSAFGLSGQKCSALSRVYVDEEVAAELLDRLAKQTDSLAVGDPLDRAVYMGPVATREAYERYQAVVPELAADGGNILAGGHTLTDGALANGYFVAPTLVAAPKEHPLYARELFLPILMVATVKDRDEAMAEINASPLGLTAGVYGNQEEVDWFLDQVEAGVTYVNRPQGATTGAWPGYQPFGGWKGSGCTGCAIASFYYLARYMREQSQTVVE
ncbi:aldehyde dehydrogenase family protein [Kordiimonas marina]|uniref:aldehyde dehydrogenase family protein n=1 Tax=Kordiimonas marina TaxID=2872312 RepID=UPI001FF26397|nr:aldehyde dehydrogenase family protein [Kordiimonas marina]MCJ9430644.1 aldehyde dehydrogenase family protein [Kordiimonas marina]